MEIIVKELRIKCAAELPAKFIMKCSPPFSISQERFELEPEEETSINVSFDPSHSADRISS